MTLVRFLLAAFIPLTNDEAYYWDWGRELHLSYLDHPPGVAWLASIAQQLFPANSALAGRGLIPIVYLLATWFLVQTAKLLKDSALSERELLILFTATQLVPGFSFLGVLLLPDSGLLLALSIVVWATVRIDRKGRPAQLPDLLVLGLAIGSAVDFKYHALLICPGCLAALVWRRKLTFNNLLVIAGAVIIAALPPILWNLQNGMASFVFQSSHGFSDPALTPIAAMRTTFGIFVFLGPWYVLRAFRASAGSALVLLAFLPITLLFFGLAWVKQVMPHWLIPGFWVALPFLTLLRPNVGSFTERSYGVIFAWCLPLIFAITPVRERLLDSFAGAPGPLAEITIWPKAARAAEAFVDRSLSNNGCRSEILGLRWYWTAQLAFAMSGQPIIGNFDPNRASYYSFRTSKPLSPCPAVLIGFRDQFASASQYFEISHQEEVILPQFQDNPIVMALGRQIQAAQPLTFHY